MMPNRWGTPTKADAAQAKAAKEAAKAAALASQKTNQAAYIARWKGAGRG
jgi:hypothetical protein